MRCAYEVSIAQLNLDFISNPILGYDVFINVIASLTKVINEIREVQDLEKLNWIRDLLLEEQEKEEQGVKDLTLDIQPVLSLEKSSIEFLRELKATFTETAHIYNSYRQEVSSQIKIYGVSKTVADFMIFRNNIRLIFSIIEPGVIQVYSSQLHTALVGGVEGNSEPSTSLIHLIKAKIGAYEELQWTYKGQLFNKESLVKYYFTLFIRMSASH